jgi:4-hydroxy-tetrahydrodipicolinate reductase
MPHRGHAGFAGVAVCFAGREPKAARSVRVALFGRGGKVGSVLGPALEAAEHELVDLGEAEAMVDFTAPEAVVDHVTSALDAGVPCVVGTTGWDPAAIDEAAREKGLPVLYAPNFAIGAVLMMRLAEQAARYLPRAEIVELHGEHKKDAPSGTAKATADRLGGASIHSVRLPGLIAHQEVLLGGDGQLLTIRHDAFSREAYVPGVLLALDRLHTLPPGVTVGLEALLD